MLHIIAAERTGQQLNRLLQQYDRATMQSDRDRIAEEVTREVGPRVKSLLRRSLRGLQVQPDEINSMADEAVMDALESYGRTRFKRTDIVPEYLIQKMKDEYDPYGSSLWSLLTDGLQGELSAATWVKAPLAQKLVDALNRLLDQDQLAQNLGVDRTRQESAMERSNANAELLRQLFPEAIKAVERPQNPSLMGFLSAFSIPKIRNRVMEESNRPSQDDIKAFNRIQPLIEELRAATGRDPVPEEVHKLYRDKLNRQFGPKLVWWDDQVRRLRPQNPFNVNSPAAYRDAKALLEQAGYDPVLWKGKDAPYYLSVGALKPMGLRSIQRLLETPGLGRPAAPGETFSQPQATGPSESSMKDDLSWVADHPASGGQLYRETVDRLYSAPGFEAERLVGEFLAVNPNAGSDQVERFLAALPSDLAEDIRAIGFENLAREIDRRVLEQVTQRLENDPVLSTTAVHELRTTVFARNCRRLRLALAG